MAIKSKSPSRKPMITLLLTVGVLVLAVILAVGFIKVQKTPQYAVLQMSTAIEDKDHSKFQDWVNTTMVMQRYEAKKRDANPELARQVDKVTNRAVDKFNQAIEEGKDIEQSQSAALAGESLAIRLAIYDWSLQRIDDQVKAGTFQPRLGIGNLLDAYNRVKVVKDDDVDAKVEVRTKEGETIVLELSKDDNKWKVVEVPLKAYKPPSS